jgi:hypothetical protein
MAPGDDPEHADSHHHHGLGFQYDCDAPKCRINVYVILPADHPLSENVDSSGFSRILVFESVVEGGFGKVLKLEEGATLELGRFEQSPLPDESSSPEKPVADSPPEGPEAPSSTNAHNGRARKRFTAFNFRKRGTDRAASGPALAVVDAETASPTADGEKEKEAKDDMRDGVRVTIRLSALDEDGLGMATVNEQTTYLHVVRLGVAPTGDEEDARPWVVQVIKREATVSRRFLSSSFTTLCLTRSYFRLARTLSIYTRSTVYPLNRPPLPNPKLHHHQPQMSILTHPRLPPLRLLFMNTNPPPNVSSACPPPAKSSSYRAATWSPVKSVRSTWSSSVREVTLCMPKITMLPQTQELTALGMVGRTRIQAVL